MVVKGSLYTAVETFVCRSYKALRRIMTVEILDIGTLLLLHGFF